MEPASYDLYNNHHTIRAVFAAEGKSIAFLFSFISPVEVDVYKLRPFGPLRMEVAVDTIKMRIAEGDEAEIRLWQQRLAEKGGRPLGGFPS